ncbi:hypothetical protein QKG93_14605 [Clavibacter michiganensis]|uniref:hypothetical protein n=1 Tax=Clavibacter michiganensis TaxID=28447 RepID=UPI0026DACCA9|nr:hypothetical protein [Clavibacter michiganensis]MDO4027165.1 hypothetical protein [Clavibacter michiganensis]MDO4135171.1 hypothetical protein [Clavibacter michiganensis]
MATALIAAVAAAVGIVDSGTPRPWLSFVLTVVVVALVLGLLPRMRGWRTVPWLSIAMVAVIAAGFISSSGIILGLGALLFVIATGAHEARSRRSSGAAR